MSKAQADLLIPFTRSSAQAASCDAAEGSARRRPGVGRLGGRPRSLGPRITFTLDDNGGKPGPLPPGGCPVTAAAQAEEGAHLDPG